MLRFISLGADCQPAQQIQKNGRREKHFFDWLSTPINSVIRLIENDFEHYLRLEDLVPDQDRHKLYKVTDKYNQIDFAHDFEAFDERNIKAVQARYEYLADKFRSLFDDATEDPPFFVRRWHPIDGPENEGLALQLHRALRARRHDIRLLYLHNDGSRKEIVLENYRSAFLAQPFEGWEGDSIAWSYLLNEFSTSDNQTHTTRLGRSGRDLFRTTGPSIGSIAKIHSRRDATFIVTEAGDFIPLTRDGRPVVDVGQGWSPVFVAVITSEVWLLELRHQSGIQAAWYLDGHGRVVAYDFAQLQEKHRHAIGHAVIVALKGLLRDMFAALGRNDDTVGSIQSPSVLLLSKPILRTIMHPALIEMSSGPCIDCAASPDATFKEPCSDGGEVFVFARHLLQAPMGANIVDLMPNIVMNGGLEFLSPVDGLSLISNRSLVLHNFFFLYVFIDFRYGLPFCVLAATHVCKIIAVYFPLSNRLYAKGRWEQEFISREIPFQKFDAALLDHLANFDRTLRDYLQRPSRNIVALLRHRHLGHHLWQDLSAVAAMAAAIPEQLLPKLYMLSASQSEMFGPIDVLYPSFAGRVDRSVEELPSLILHAYEQGECVTSVAATYIRRDLAKRILNHAMASPYVTADRALVKHLIQDNRPIVLLGLRVENRTVVDFPRFCVEMVGLLGELTGDRAVIVVDGHNTVHGRAFDSSSDHLALESPILVEKTIVQAIRDVARGTKIDIVDLVGAPMERSLIWSEAADFFITPWGAGLVKYKWLSNRPGLVLTSRYYIEGKFDLNIYDSPEFIEAGLPLNVINVEDVEDDAEDQPLIQIQEPTRINFRVRPEAVRREVEAMLQACEGNLRNRG